MSELDKESTAPGQPPVTPPEPVPAPPPPEPALLPVSPVEPAPPPGGWWVPPSTPPAAAVPDNSLWHRVAAAVVLVAVVAAAGGVGIGWSLGRAINTRTAQNQAQPIQAANPSPASGGSSQTGNLNLAAIAAKVDPAIVDINTTLPQGSAAGTGMILTSSGEALTNNHVVDQSTSISVTVMGRTQTYTAHVVGVNRSADIAVIQLEGASGLPTVSFASSTSLQVGDPVVALGNALGHGGTPSETQGNITALDQTITASEGGGKSETLTGTIQSDANISQGDSGGPLVNSAGQVIGMITAGEAQGFRSTSSNIAYAIPSDSLVSVANQIRSGQTSSAIIYGPIGYLGVTVQTLDSNAATQLGLKISSGVLVVSVLAGTPASSAGITRSSVITSLGGAPITTTESLGAVMQSHKPGEQVSVTWVNQSGTHTSTLTLGRINP